MVVTEINIFEGLENLSKVFEKIHYARSYNYISKNCSLP